MTRLARALPDLGNELKECLVRRGLRYCQLVSNQCMECFGLLEEAGLRVSTPKPYK